jgi:hypothetical protein
LIYLLTRYFGWAIGERRRFKREMDARHVAGLFHALAES